MKDIKHNAKDMKTESKARGEVSSHNLSTSHGKDHGSKVQGHADKRKKGC